MTDRSTTKDEPSRELEEKLARNPHDADAKVDVGLDESMDASDPVSATRSDDEEPHPNSDAPKD